MFHVLCCTMCEVLMYLAVKQKFGRYNRHRVVAVALADVIRSLP